MAGYGEGAGGRSWEQLLAAAEQLAEADETLMYELVQARKAAKLSQRDVADLLGVKQSTIAAFERHDNDPKLSTIRRYAVAVGAAIQHRVITQQTVSFASDRYTFHVTPAPVQRPTDAPSRGHLQLLKSAA